MSVYAKHFSTKKTPQTEKIPGSTQVPNSAGGFSFPVDNWTRLDRWLILGNEGGSYYASEKKMTIENATAVQECLKEDPIRTVCRIVEVSKAGRAPKNDPAIFALAMAAAYKGDVSNVKMAVHISLPEVCRIGTHLFQFAEAVQNFRGWGRGLRSMIADWYLSKEPKDLAYQAMKYQNRNGWTHRDLLRLCHINPTHRDEDKATIFNWIVKGWPEVGDKPHDRKALQGIWAFETAKKAIDKKTIVRLIRDYDLPRECIPTAFLNEADVWEALLEKMPMTAMVRNLATMTRVGLLAPMSKGVGKVLGELANVEKLRKSRLHPVAVLAALLTYKQGHGEKGKHTWNPVTQIVDALDGAFYNAFQNVEPTGKRFYLGCDVSGSMYSAHIAGIAGLTAGLGAAAMAMVTARVESQYYLAAFDTVMHPFTVSPRQRLDDVANMMRLLPWGGTNCSLPMIDALEKKILVDTFVVYTDSETYAGNIHPTQALNEYRQKMGIPAKLVVVGMVSNGFTIADPTDNGMLDCAGFDTATPQVISDFSL